MSLQNSIRDMFFEESEELLEALTEGLAQMARGDHSDDTVNAVFRAVHSIKGSAGAFKLAALVAFAHRFETVLDAVRDHRLAIEAEVMRVLQRSADHLADLVEAARNGVDGAAEGTAGFLAALAACLGETGAACDPEATADDSFGFAAITLDFALSGDESDLSPDPPEPALVIAFRPEAGLYRNGHDPALLIATLADFGALTVELDLTQLPDFAAFWVANSPNFRHRNAKMF